MLAKLYDADPERGRRYSPTVGAGADPKVVFGAPDPAHISTSYVERQNLTMRTSMRRFIRLANAFSKKLQNHMHAISLHFMHHNYARPRHMLKNLYPQTPAMAAGIEDHVGTSNEVISLLWDATEPLP
jgi:hypothetical protein